MVWDIYGPSLVMIREELWPICVLFGLDMDYHLTHQSRRYISAVFYCHSIVYCYEKALYFSKLLVLVCDWCGRAPRQYHKILDLKTMVHEEEYKEGYFSFNLRVRKLGLIHFTSSTSI